MSQVTTVNSIHVLVGPPQTPKEISLFSQKKKVISSFDPEYSTL
jgi:hypothetical protein